MLYSDYWFWEINTFTAFKNPLFTSKSELRGLLGWKQHDTSSLYLSTGFIRSPQWRETWEWSSSEVIVCDISSYKPLTGLFLKLSPSLKEISVIWSGYMCPSLCTCVWLWVCVWVHVCAYVSVFVCVHQGWQPEALITVPSRATIAPWFRGCDGNLHFKL